MVRGPTPPQVVVVHGRQVVVDQRHRVDHLQGDGGGNGELRVLTGQFAGRQAQNRPQALTAGQQGVAHRLPQGFRPLRGQGAVEGLVHPGPGSLQIGGEIEGLGHRRGHGELLSGLDSLRRQVFGEWPGLDRRFHKKWMAPFLIHPSPIRPLVLPDPSAQIHHLFLEPLGMLRPRGCERLNSHLFRGSEQKP